MAPRVASLASWLLLACGGGAAERSPASATPAVAAAPAPEPAAATHAEPAPIAKPAPKAAPPPPGPAVPNSCHAKADLCLMPPEFAERLCTAKYTDLALYLFQKAQPWTRGYIRSKEVDVVNTLGGPVSETKLQFGEEVLIVGRRGGGDGKVQVSGNAGYQVLRWDGTCATLADHEIVTYVPGAPHGAPIVWEYLADALQEALLTNSQIEAARESTRAECRGVRHGGHSKRCERALRKLNDAITVAVRSGMELPLPERIPD